MQMSPLYSSSDVLLRDRNVLTNHFNIYLLIETFLKLHHSRKMNDYSLFYCSDSEFDWIVITSPEAAAVFLEAWK